MQLWHKVSYHAKMCFFFFNKLRWGAYKLSLSLHVPKPEASLIILQNLQFSCTAVHVIIYLFGHILAHFISLSIFWHPILPWGHEEIGTWIK